MKTHLRTLRTIGASSGNVSDRRPEAPEERRLSEPEETVVGQGGLQNGLYLRRRCLRVKCLRSGKGEGLGVLGR